jgi:hypothetical protein
MQVLHIKVTMFISFHQNKVFAVTLRAFLHIYFGLADLKHVQKRSMDRSFMNKSNIKVMMKLQQNTA